MNSLMATLASDTDHCHALVRRHDKDRYLASLFAPDEMRSHLWALYAFNYETARIREMVSSPAAGELRLQWWADTVASIHSGEPPDHPVARALGRAVEYGDLPKTALMNMIEARRFDLYDDPMPSLNDLEGYLGETSSGPMHMASLLLAGPSAAPAAHAAGLGGVAYGLAGLLRALPLHRARGQCYVPKDLLAREGLSPAELIAGEPREPISRVLQALLALASERLDQARAERNAVPDAALPAFLPLAVVESYLARIRQLGVKVLDQIADVPQWRRQWRLWRWARQGRF
jgi:15-cis-phytoene synthase